MTFKSAKTQAHIIATAAKLINKKGYNNTSMSDLQKAAGLSKGCLYGNFKNKDAIAIAAFEHNTALLFKGKEAIVGKSNISAIEKLYALLKLQAKNVSSEALIGGCPMLNSSIEVDDNYEYLKESVITTLKIWEKELTEIIQIGQKNKEIKNEIDPTYWAGVFISLIEGGIMLSKIHSNNRYLENSLSSIKTLIIQELVIAPK